MELFGLKDVLLNKQKVKDIYFQLSNNFYLNIERLNMPLPNCYLNLIVLNNHRIPLIFDYRNNKELSIMLEEKKAIEHGKTVFKVVEENTVTEKDVIALKLPSNDFPKETEIETLRRRLKKGEWLLRKQLIESRLSYLKELTNVRFDLLKLETDKISDLYTKVSERFYSDFGYEYQLLKLFGVAHLPIMRESAQLTNQLFEGKFERLLNHDLDYCGRQWLVWSVVKDLAQQFKQRLLNETSCLKDYDNSLTDKLENVAENYSWLSDKAESLESQIGLTLAQELFICNIYSLGKLPRIKSLKEMLLNSLF